MNLSNNYEDIVGDRTLMESSIIAFSETWLEQKIIIHLDLITVYRSKGNTTELLHHLINLINNDMPTVVCGDFNICYQISRNNKITQCLEKNGFVQLMKESKGETY